MLIYIPLVFGFLALCANADISGEDAEVYRNRKGYFSINVQAVSDADLKFLNIVARWPGSVHDVTLFNGCALRAEFEAGMYPNCLLLAFPCRTPDNKNAHCVSLFACPHLMKLLGSSESSAIDFVRKSICLGCEAGDFMVCCGSPNNSTDSTIVPDTPVVSTSTKDDVNVANKNKETQRDMKRKLLPTLAYCGLQHTDDRFYNGTSTALDEFPWLVHVKLSDFEYEEEYGDRCNGVLISNRYVLTEAYCGYEGIKVTLGQHITNQSVSCIDDPNLPECSDPAIEIRVEEKIRDGKQGNGPYDFTLLRLNQTVTYTDFIRPICLPMDESKRPQKQDSLTFSGWGSSGPQNIIKKRLTYDVVDNKVCYKEKDWLEGNVKFANVTLICVAPQNVEADTACNGERGGPFMYSKRHQWFVEGIIVDASAEGTPDSCSNSKPINGIKITPKTINWILDSIRP